MSLGYGASIVREGLVLHLDAANQKSYLGTGTTWYDLSKTKTTAVGVNGPVFNSDHVTFDGTNDRFYIGGELVYGSGVRTLSEMSVFAWIRTTFNSGTVGTWDSSNWSILDFDRSEVFTFAVNGTGEIQMSGRSVNYGGFNTHYDLIGNTRYNDGNWHMIGWTFSVTNQEIVMYADGEVDRVHTANGSMSPLGSGTTRYGYVGDGSEAGSVNGGGNNLYYQGDIATLLFYDGKSLTPNEVKDNFNASKGRFGL